MLVAASYQQEKGKEQSVPSGIVAGASVLRGSPRLLLAKLAWGGQPVSSHHALAGRCCLLCMTRPYCCIVMADGAFTVIIIDGIRVICPCLQLLFALHDKTFLLYCHG